MATPTDVSLREIGFDRKYGHQRGGGPLRSYFLQRMGRQKIHLRAAMVIMVSISSVWTPVRAQVNVLNAHVSAASVDCLWAQVPTSMKQALERATTGDALFASLQDWDPSNSDIIDMGKACGVSGNSDRPAGAVAAIAIGCRALDAWTVSQLTGRFGYTNEQLTVAWRGVTPAARSALARHWLAGANGPPPEDAMNGIQALLTALHPPSHDALAPITFYAFGHSLLEVLEADE